ncbi:MAG: M1 family aminopeptidase, partial [Candidatus Binatia bacterium]
GPYHEVRETHDGIDLGVFCRRSMARYLDADDIFIVTRQGFDFFHSEFGIRYPLPKYDQVFVPEFNAGAMENFGCIVHAESHYIFRSQVTDFEHEQRANTILHEMAHMWFGDLVTMRWWNGLWLNEAFATFMEMLAVDAWKPEWRRWDSFTVSRAAALHVDGLKSTRPIEFPVQKPEDAAGMFDVLTYEKGASVLRMLEQYLGADVFRDGIRVYLRRHEYSNAETTDLWDALEGSSGQPVRTLMDSWIFQPGYPLISVERDEKGLLLSQRLFRYLQDGQDESRRWHVPVFLRAHTQGGTINQTVLLTDPAQRVDFDASVEWVVANAGGHGFYRARYSADLISALKNDLQQNLLPVERFNLINDTWATTLAGLTSLGDYLDLIDLLRDETNLNVWTTVLASCHHLHRIFDERQRSRFQTRLRHLLQPAVTRLGWSPKSGETELESQLRSELIGALGTLADDPDAQQKAQQLYPQFERDPKAVDRNLVPALVAIVAHTGDRSNYEKFGSNFKNARTPQEEQRYLFALAGFRQRELIQRTLESTTNGEVRTQNAPYLLRALLFNTDARETAWSFMKEHWDEMLNQYPDNSIPRMCEGIVALVKAELEADVRNFFARHPVKQGGRSIEQHLERLGIAVACKERWKDLLREG